MSNKSEVNAARAALQLFPAKACPHVILIRRAAESLLANKDSAESTNFFVKALAFSMARIAIEKPEQRSVVLTEAHWELLWNL